MQVDLEVRRDGDTTIVAARGEFDIATAPQVSDALAQLRDHDRICIDLTHVTFIDSSATRELAFAARSTIDRGGDFAVVCPPPNRNVRRVLDFMGLDAVVAVFDDLGSALSDR